MSSKRLVIIILLFLFSDGTVGNAQTVSFYNKEKALTINKYIRDYSELPIKPARTIRFETEESTRIDMDISPDGKQLLFTILGEIFLMPAEGGTAVQLTRGMAVNFSPQWSQDGKYFVYLSDASGDVKIHLRDLSGKFHQVINQWQTDVVHEITAKYKSICRRVSGSDQYVVWTPNGPNASDGRISPKISSLKKDISDSAEFGKLPEMSSTFSSSADGRSMFYLKKDGKSLLALRVNSYVTDTLTLIKDFDPGASFSKMRISPDGESLVYVVYDREQSVYSLRLRRFKTGEVKIVEEGAMSMGEGNFVFSPDSRFVYANIGGKINRYVVSSGEKKAIPFSAVVESDFGPLTLHQFPIDDEPVRIKNIRNGQVTKDGRIAVFSAIKQIMKYETKSKQFTILADGPGMLYGPVISPDEESVAYCSFRDKEGGQLYKIDIRNSGSPVLLASFPNRIKKLAWNPDGSGAVVFLVQGVNKNPSGQISYVDFGSGSVEVLVQNVNASSPISIWYSRDGSELFFSERKDRNMTLNKFNFRTRTQSPELEIKSARSDEDYLLDRSFLITPDRKHLFFLYNDDLYCSKLSGDGNSRTVTEATRIFSGAADLYWEEGEIILGWSFGNRIYRTTLTSVISKLSNGNLIDDPFKALPFTARESHLKPEFEIAIAYSVPKLQGKGLLALTDTRIITMENDRVIEHGTILIKDRRIIQVGPLEEVRIPTGATTIKMSGKTIIPGFVGSHEHIDSRGEEIMFEEEKALRVYFAYGETTAFNPSCSMDLFKYGEMLEVGAARGSRYFSVGQTFGPYHGIPAINQKEANSIVRNHKLLGAVAIKQYKQRSRAQQQYVMLAADKFKLNCTNESGPMIYEFLTQLKNGTPKIEHADNGVWRSNEDFFKLVSRAGTYVTSTHVGRDGLNTYYSVNFRDTSGKFEHYLPDFNRSTSVPPEFLKPRTQNQKLSFYLVKAVRMGTPIPTGSHGDIPGMGIHFELWDLVSGGATPLEAITSATLTSAKGLGMSQDIGSIKEGKIADLVILNSNPLENIHNTKDIIYVMKDGILYDDETLEIVSPAKIKQK